MRLCSRVCARPRVFIMVNSDRRSYSACPYLSLSHLNCILCKHLFIPQLLAVITCHRGKGEQNPPQPLSILYQHARMALVYAASYSRSLCECSLLHSNLQSPCLILPELGFGPMACGKFFEDKEQILGVLYSPRVVGSECSVPVFREWRRGKDQSLSVYPQGH